MKNKLLVGAAMAALLCGACAKTEVASNTAAAGETHSASHNDDSEGPQAVSTQPKDGEYSGNGRITKINADAGSVEIDHQRIIGVMEPMIMEFNVRDKAILKDVKVGDQVDFVLEYKHPSETIISIKKTD